MGGGGRTTWAPRTGKRVSSEGVGFNFVGVKADGAGRLKRKGIFVSYNNGPLRSFRLRIYVSFV